MYPIQPALLQPAAMTKEQDAVSLRKPKLEADTFAYLEEAAEPLDTDEADVPHGTTRDQSQRRVYFKVVSAKPAKMNHTILE